MPRPNYWAAVLWRRTMGTTVLASPASPSADLRIYAHCLAGRRGGVGLAVINLGDVALTVPVGKGSRIWTIEAQSLDSKAVTVNGRHPQLENNGDLSGLAARVVSGTVSIPGKAVAFIAVGAAGNPGELPLKPRLPMRAFAPVQARHGDEPRRPCRFAA